MIAAAHTGQFDPAHSSMVTMLSQPSSGDDFYVRNAVHQQTQRLSDALFKTVHEYTGGDAPTVQMVPQVDPNGVFHAQAILGQNQINVDPETAVGLITEANPYHSGTVNVMPHEMAHLRQLADVLSNPDLREGGAQAFADIVSPLAAALAGTGYDASRNYDGAYAVPTQNVLAQQGRGWVLASQFGSPQVP